MKKPISEVLLAESMLVVHDPVVNPSMEQPIDKGLKPNGLTIESMRENIEFYTPRDPLDRLAVASQTSALLSDKVQQAVQNLQALTPDKIKQINQLFTPKK